MYIRIETESDKIVDGFYEGSASSLQIGPFESEEDRTLFRDSWKRDERMKASNFLFQDALLEGQGAIRPEELEEFLKTHEL